MGPEDLAQFEPMWTSEKWKYYLVRFERGYLPIDRSGAEEMMVLIDEDEEFADAVAAKMIEAGVPVVDNRDDPRAHADSP